MKSLIAFVRVARSGSFTAAAAELEISTAAVSKSVSRLERNLTTRLFTRSTRQLALTAEGRLFLDKVEAALTQVDEGIDLLREARTEPAGTLRLWTSVAIGKDHVLPMLASFLERWPKVSIDLRCDDHLPNLIATGYDLAVHHASLSKGTNVIKRLAELPLVLVASPAYLARHGIPKTPDELADHQCVATRSSAVPVARWEFRRRSARGGRASSVIVQPRGRITIAEQYDAVMDAALCGLGVTAVFAHSALRHLESGRLQVVLPDWQPHAGATLETDQVYLWYPHRTYVSYNVRALVDFLTVQFRDHARLAIDLRRWAAG